MNTCVYVSISDFTHSSGTDTMSTSAMEGNKVEEETENVCVFVGEVVG